jgi:hypothetical protein
MSWPTNIKKFEEAMRKASPEQKLILKSLITDVRDAMDCTLRLHYAIWRWHADHDMDYEETEWPCDLDSLRAVTADGKHDDLNSLYIMAVEGVPAKAALDKMVADFDTVGGAREGGAREGGAREGGTREGGAREGGTREGGAREGGTREGGTREGVNEGMTEEECAEVTREKEKEQKEQEEKPRARYSMCDLQRILGYGKTE